jgi:glycerol dehydrogenase
LLYCGGFLEIHKTYHGEIVAFGILGQLCMEQKEEEIQDLISYYDEVILPYTLRQMGIRSLTNEQWNQLGDVSVTIE